MLYRMVIAIVLLSSFSLWQGCGQSDFNDSEVNSAVKTTDTKTIIDTDNDKDNGEWVYLNDSSNANDFYLAINAVMFIKEIMNFIVLKQQVYGKHLIQILTGTG